MKKKILALFMSLFVALSLSACSAGEIVDFATNNVTDGGSSTQNGTNSETAKKAADTNPAGMKTIAKDKLKIGVLYIFLSTSDLTSLRLCERKISTTVTKKQ